MSVVKSVADMFTLKGLQRPTFKSDQEPSVLDLKNRVVAELGGSLVVIMEASPMNEHRSDSWSHDSNSQSWRFNSRTGKRWRLVMW